MKFVSVVTVATLL